MLEMLIKVGKDGINGIKEEFMQRVPFQTVGITNYRERA